VGDQERLTQARELVQRRRDGYFGEKSEIELVELVAGMAEVIAFQGIQIRSLIDDVTEIAERFRPLGEEEG
jgi:hypothetical protein